MINTGLIGKKTSKVKPQKYKKANKEKQQGDSTIKGQRRFWCSGQGIRAWYVKKMELTFESLLDVVDRLGWTGGRTDLLTYPEYVIFKGIDTIIDEKRIRLGLKMNVYADPFNPQIFTKVTENNASNHEMKQPQTEHLNKPTRKEEQWKRVPKKQKTIRKTSDSIKIPKNVNPFKPLEMMEREDSVKEAVIDERIDESSCKSDQTPRVRNVQTKEKSKENNVNEYNIERATMEVF